MSAPAPDSRPEQRTGQEGRRGRETRLLLATIAISVAVLVLLARFRFPDQADPAAEPAPAPLERLAARATYDELAAIMGDLERRLAPRLVVVHVQPDRPGGQYAIAARMTPNRAVVHLAPHETIGQSHAGYLPVLARDNSRDIAVLSVPEAADDTVTPAAGPLRPGPRYIAVVEANAQGPVIRPIYVGRTDILQDPRTTSPVLSIAALQQALPRGAAVFSLSGNFLGLAADGGATATVIPGDILLASAQSARAVDETRGDVGVTVQPLTAGLSRATGAERGVVVSYVHPRGPAVDLLEPGDVIQSVDGTAVSTPAGFQQVVQSRPPGGQSALDVMRRGKPIEVQITVRDATGAPLPPLPEDDPGLVMRLVPDLGVEIVAVRPGSAAARANLAAGDIILRLNGALAPSPAALLSAYRQLPAQGALLLAVQRGADHRAVALER
jgi:hypothetical protein